MCVVWIPVSFGSVLNCFELFVLFAKEQARANRYKHCNNYEFK